MMTPTAPHNGVTHAEAETQAAVDAALAKVQSARHGGIAPHFVDPKVATGMSVGAPAPRGQKADSEVVTVTVTVTAVMATPHLSANG